MAEGEAVPPQLVDSSGNPVESDQLKTRLQQLAVTNAIEEWSRRQLCALASGVLANATKKLIGSRTSIGQVKPGAQRMAFWVAFRVREHFLKTATQPPAWVNDYKIAVPNRRRRAIIREFRDRDRRLLHLAASAIISDTEFASATLATWNTAFQEAKDAEDTARALGVDAGRTHSAAIAAAEADRARDVSLRDAPHASPTIELVTSATL